MKKVVDSLKTRAEKIAKDPAAFAKLIENAQNKAATKKGYLREVQADLSTLLKLLRASMTGAYRKTPWTTIVSGIAALIYFVNPVDIIPDFLIGAGFLDDISVFLLVLKAMRKDLDEFEVWRKENQPEEK